ncbi:type IV pilin protein [Cellulomonas oligotrophica]|uniref:Prepilin-type N-terminal cleavage/methylation domain-containing protein n=1 Tax=Cellulomonas oligotrophica TaxID=931536 RepID=A0A7Y9FCA4_9CELL|nr:type II secretion system protein [Cellulomonas oligotrophica]NYD84684.1 prepilin-type N-terminal cleavage/methylation domain-containing protein [Cellulomonas oligotrophica]GIG31751.1 hypothetical protein Col01nite_09100 [Cellulomonas oligotrophica]
MTPDHPAAGGAARERGFTLTELLVVVIIIGVLAAIAVPVLIGQRTSAIEASVQSDLRNLLVAVTAAREGDAAMDADKVRDDVRVTPGNTLDVVVDAGVYCLRGASDRGGRTYVLDADGLRPQGGGDCGGAAVLTLP